MNRLFTKTTIAEAVMLAIAVYSIIPAVSATELDLPTAPLITTKSVEPNMMLLLDSSSSMYTIVVEENTTDSPYDPSGSYFTCPSGNQMATSGTSKIRIPSTGDPYFNNGGDHTFGSDSGEKCFKDTDSYKIRLYADTGNATLRTTSSYGTTYYTGHYLNWYFSEGTFDDHRKHGTRSRIEMAQDAAVDLITGLENIRVGLAIYDNSDDSDGSDEGSGAKILVNIGSIGEVGDTGTTATQRNSIISEIESIVAVGFTPLGESIMDLGKYYTIKGTEDQLLTLHPDGTPENQLASAIYVNGPAYSSISAPTGNVIENWCQNSSVLAMTDGLPSNGRDVNVSSYLNSYATSDSTSEYADDVVNGMFEIDHRPDLTEAVNNVTTYMVGFSEPQVINSTLIKNMANFGVGATLTEDNLLVASSSTELDEVFKTITNKIFAKQGAGSGISFNTSQLSAESEIYSASFNSEKWSGSLKSYELSDTGVISLTAKWDASTVLNGSTDYLTRNIFSYDTDSDALKGIVFNLTNVNAASSLLADLEVGPKGSSEVSSLIDYLKGAPTNEGSSVTDYRNRVTNSVHNALGDIVNSTVVHVGVPELSWPDYDTNNKFGANDTDEYYSKFKSDLEASPRTEMLYVGANDGMLHGFNAATGEEEFAYIPASLASSSAGEGLHYLAETDYAHQFYVDLTPTVSDVYLDSAWRTVLVGGLRGGGKGLFALDITDPDDFTSSDAHAEQLALWEFSSTDDADFGYSYSEPTIAMMANGKWAVITGNGYNSDTDTAKLFIIFIEEGTDGSWDAGDYIKIDTGSTGSPNGLSTPRAVDLDGDKVVDRIYAGDLQGNMWAFDVSGNTNQWDVAHKTGNTAQPLFTATDGTNRQPITTAPIVAENTNPGTDEPNIIVFFGTGKYIEEADKTSTNLMSYYGVLDNGTGNQTRSNLTSRELYSTSTTRVISGSTMTWSSSRGWYFDFEDQADSSATPVNIGERVISNSLITNDVLLFNTVIPTVANSDPCVSNSESWIMAVDLNTGKAPLYTVFDINKDGIFNDTTDTYDVDGDGDVDVDDAGVSFGGTKIDAAMIAGNIAILADTIYSNDVDGNLTETDVNIEGTDKQGRLSWEEQVPQ